MSNPPPLTGEQLSWAAEMRGQGMPSNWIADTLGCAIKSITTRYPMAGEDQRAWKTVWLQIRKDPRLLELHREFCPQSTAGYRSLGREAMGDAPSEDLGALNLARDVSDDQAVPERDHLNQDLNRLASHRLPNHLPRPDLEGVAAMALMQELTNYLQNLAVGEATHVETRGHTGALSTRYSRHVVVKITPTQIVTKDFHGREWRFRKNSGQEVGHLTHPARIVHPESSDLALGLRAQRLSNLRARLNSAMDAFEVTPSAENETTLRAAFDAWVAAKVEK